MNLSATNANAMSDYIQVVTTTEHREDAERIARELVEVRLAACVQIVGPVTSIYRWRGKVETAQEWQCWIKSRSGLFPQIEQAIRRLHPYEVPEILAMPVIDGSPDYLKWLGDETASSDAAL
jgi:periplasmic divalent cation tolerance protein